MSRLQYAVECAEDLRALADPWQSDLWAATTPLRVDSFHPRSSDHRPRTLCRMLHDRHAVYVIFEVYDRFVRCVHDGYQSAVSRDSCVEFFLQPRSDAGYFSFEINCGGALLLYYIEDPARTEIAPFRRYTAVPRSFGGQVNIRASLPRRIEPELTDATTWTIRCRVPTRVFSNYVGAVGDLSGQCWLGNFFKCADETSHPHWASWSPIGEVLRFHQPQYFRPIHFR